MMIGWLGLDLDPAVLKPMDVGFQQSGSDISWAIRQATREPGEDVTFASHVFGVYTVPEPAPAPLRPIRGGITVFEATQPVTTITALDHYRSSRVVVFRPPGITDEDRRRMQVRAVELMGDGYPVEHLVAQLIDRKVIGEYLLRRLSLSPGLVCQATIEYLYRYIDKPIASHDLGEGSPDDLLDSFVRREWEIVWVDSQETLRLFRQAYPWKQVDFISGIH